MKTLFFSIFFLISCALFSQNEGNIWYFGSEAGIDFNDLTPVALTNGVMDTGEGCASISDNSGNLLFYTNGVNVYNADHDTMTNGAGLYGHPTSTQSVIIVKDPGNAHLHYVFTVGSVGSGLHYSIVDMSLQDGLGEVTILNVPVVSTAAEKIAVIKHENGTDFWIVTLKSHPIAQFHSYLLTSSGLDLTPVISPFDYPFSIRGYLKSNRQGDRIAVANTTNPVGDQFQIYDFDKATGMLFNGMSFDRDFAYGVEFSPDGNLLYVSCWYSLPTNYLFQYNLEAGDGSLSDVMDSEVNLSDPNAIHSPGAIQLGPDLKAYFTYSGSDSLGIINNPNIVGMGCNYELNGLSLEGHISGYGLPAFFNTIYNNEDTDLGVNEINPNQFTISIAPNPTFGLTNLFINLEKETTVTVAVKNLLGQPVLAAESRILSTGANLFPIDLSSQLNGIYFVKVSVNNSVKVLKIYIEK